MKEDKKQRRNFLKVALATLATVGLATVTKKAFQKNENKKIKMLTPDGKLVEVDESVVKQAGGTRQRASNKDVQQWMKTSKTD